MSARQIGRAPPCPTDFVLIAGMPMTTELVHLSVTEASQLLRAQKISRSFISQREQTKHRDIVRRSDGGLAIRPRWWFQNPMASRSSRTVPRPGWGSALRMSRRLMALGCPYATWARALSSGRQ